MTPDSEISLVTKETHSLSLSLSLSTQLEAMQNIAKACRSRSVSELEQVVKEHSQHVSSDPIMMVRGGH